MGHGSYTANDWASLRSSKGLVRDNEVKNIFVGQEYVGQKRVSPRESRDSEDSPNSTPIIIGFDVTSSMGYLAKELAVNAINKCMMSLIDKKVVPNPQILSAAIGDVKSDKAPLQVTQFESDIRIIKQLTSLYLEGGGGGNGAESYNLLWYFAAKHTSIDSFEKRNKKGFLFTIGDDNCHYGLNKEEIKMVFGDEVPYVLSNEELIRMAQEKYHVFHINIETNKSNDKNIFTKWQSLLPGHATAIDMKDIECISDLITTIISVANGVEVNTALKLLNQDIAERIGRSMAFIDVTTKNTIMF